MNVKLLVNISILFNYLAFVVGLFRYRYFSKEIKIIFFFVAFGVLTQLYMELHQNYIMKNTMPIGHFYFPIAFLIISLFYIQVLKGFIKPFYIIAIVVAFEMYCVINSLFIQNLIDYASLEGSISAMILFLFSVAFFTKVMAEAKISKLSGDPLIWINTSILIYYTGNFFYHSLFNLRLRASVDIALLAEKIFSLLNIIFYFIITIGFLIVKKVKPVKDRLIKT